MKVNSVIKNQYEYKPRFRGSNNDWQVFGIDEGGQVKRDYIRQWHYEHYMPYQSIYETEGRKSDYEVERMISDLIRKPVKVNDEMVQSLNLYNLDFVGDNSFRGAMIDAGELDKIGKLYEAGIRRIIHVSGGDNALRNECKKLGIDYFAIDFDCMYRTPKTIDDVKRNSVRMARDILGLDEKGINEWIENDIILWQKDTRDFIEEFIKYIQKMQKGNVYIGCGYGTYNTDEAIMFDYLFNPKMRHENGLNRFNKVLLEPAEKYLYHSLTERDKLKMGWTKEFEKIFFKRLAKLRNIIV